MSWHDQGEIARLEAELAQANARLLELAEQKPQTLKQRIRDLEAALRKVELVFGGEWYGDGAEGETLNAVRAALSGTTK